MTVIIAIEHPETGERAIAADGRTTNGGAVISDSTQKLFCASDAVFGISGEHSFHNILSGALENADYGGIADFVARCRKAIEADGIKPKDHEDGGRGTFEMEMVVVGPDGVWDIAADLSYSRVGAGLPCACGSGAREARGAAMAMIESSVDWSPFGVVGSAVETACRLVSNCGGAIQVEEVSAGRTLKAV